jgi:hypothetical protein
MSNARPSVAEYAASLALRKQSADGGQSREDQPLARIRPAARNRTVSFSNCREQGRRASDVWASFHLTSKMRSLNKTEHEPTNSLPYITKAGT